jgi:N-carbamoyl-L-amino-acid hydrolase
VETEEGRGRTVLTGSEADKNAREYLINRMKNLGMEIHVDAVGNIAGKWIPESAESDAAPVVAGSHLDSVPRGGIFDGPLGVYAALEAVRAIRESDIEPNRPLGVVSFTEEEGGRFDVGVLGSSVACERRSIDDALSLEDDSGTTLEEYLENIGFRGEGSLDVSGWNSFFEMHVEQSTHLEEQNIPVGVVTAITGITNCEVQITGETNHAGTTSMNKRSDALAAASEFILDIEQAANEVVTTDSTSAVGTIGKIDVSPNARNVVAGDVRIRTDFRDVNEESTRYLVDRAKKSLTRINAERNVETDIDVYRHIEPVPMSERCRKSLHNGASRADIEPTDMHSGAGHDTMIVASVTDVALLFVPSRDGISHNPAEWTDWDDCAAGTRVLAEGIADLSRR